MPKLVDHNQRRKLFIIAAMSVLSNKGFKDFNLRSVAEEAGFTTGAMAHYFEDKEELLLAVFHFYARHLSSRVDVLIQEIVSPRKKLEALLSNLLPTDKNRQAGWKLWFELSHLARSEQDFFTLRCELYNKWQQVLQDVLTDIESNPQGLDNENVRFNALHLLAWLDGFCLQVLTTPSRFSADKQQMMLDDVLDKILWRHTTS